MTTDILPEGFDFTDPDLNWDAIPHEQFAALRKTAPVFWVEQPPESRSGIAPEAGTGYWAVTKHADVSAVSKDSKNWSSAENGAIIRYGREIQREDVELQRVILLNQDPPEHTGTRHIISRGFTPAGDQRARGRHDRAGQPDRQGGGRAGAAATSSRSSRPSCRCRPSRS